MDTRAEKWRAASESIAAFLAKACVTDEGETHWPSVLAAAGALTGEAALMAAERHLPVQGSVLSRRAEAWLYNETDSPSTLAGYLRRVLVEAFHLPPGQALDAPHALRRVGASVGARPFPPLPPDQAHAPLFWPLNAGARWRRSVHELAAAHGLTWGEVVYALLGSLIEAIRRGRQTVPPAAAGAIGLEAMIAALRHAPLLQEDAAENAAYQAEARPDLPKEAQGEVLPFTNLESLFHQDAAPAEARFEEEPEDQETASMPAVRRQVFGRRRFEQAQPRANTP